MKSKIIILLSLCIASFVKTNAQVKLDPFYPYSKYTLGVGVGYSKVYGDMPKSYSQPVYRLNVQRNANAWVNVGLEVQKGALSGYTGKNNWTNGISSFNQYWSVALDGRVSLGEFFNYPQSFAAKTLFGLYVGAGIGYLKNDITNISTKFKKSDKYFITEFDKTNIELDENNIFIPINVGFNLHLTRKCVFNINYQFSYTFSDYVDGYNFKAPTATNEYNDMYSVLSFGLHFYMGNVNMNPNDK